MSLSKQTTSTLVSCMCGRDWFKFATWYVDRLELNLTLALARARFSCKRFETSYNWFCNLYYLVWKFYVSAVFCSRDMSSFLKSCYDPNDRFALSCARFASTTAHMSNSGSKWPKPQISTSRKHLQRVISRYRIDWSICNHLRYRWNQNGV